MYCLYHDKFPMKWQFVVFEGALRPQPPISFGPGLQCCIILETNHRALVKMHVTIKNTNIFASECLIKNKEAPNVISFTVIFCNHNRLVLLLTRTFACSHEFLVPRGFNDPIGISRTFTKSE